MHHFFHLTLMAALLGLPPQVRSQSVTDSWETLSRVDEFRRTWLEQTDSLDVCSVETADGFADTASASLSATAGALLARWRDRRCDPASTPSRSSRVSFSSLTLEDDRARVELTVSRGERLHREVALLRRHPAPRGWTVIELRVVGRSRRVLPRRDSISSLQAAPGW
jgi:hypothetical protein